MSQNNDNKVNKDHTYKVVSDSNLASKKKKPSLQELMNQITPENQHDEVDWGKPQGKELI